MMADYDIMVVQVDQAGNVDSVEYADLVDHINQVDRVDYKHNFDIGVCFENFSYEECGSEPESIEFFQKNWDGSSNLGYLCLEMDH